MDDKLLIAIVAAASAIVGGLVTGVISPLVKHHLEQSAAEKARRREKIQQWRAMVIEVNRACGDNLDVGPTLQAHPDFLSLEPHLSEETRRSCYGRNYTVVVGAALAKPLQNVTRDLARIEREWGLN